ncbi:hypothetical protein P9112_012723 [Eukaryota sp. TZLM1-RC]
MDSLPHNTSPLCTCDVPIASVYGVNLSADSSIHITAHRSDTIDGAEFISCNSRHTLLLTLSGEVYGWGDNDYDQVLYQGPETIQSPIKLPLTNVASISTGVTHSFALSSEGKLFGWGWNGSNLISMSSSHSLPITPINIPYNIKEVYGGDDDSFALTQEGKAVVWGSGKSFELIEELTNIIYLYAYCDSFVAINSSGDCFYLLRNSLASNPIIPCLNPANLFINSVALVADFLFVIDANGVVWKCDKGDDDVTFNNKPTKVPRLNNIVSVSGSEGIYAAIDIDGKVFVWGDLSRISDVAEDGEEPRCIEALTDIEGISVGFDYLYAYNKSSVWAWGKNDQGQLGTGDLIDRHEPVKVFGSEILGSFHLPKQPLDRMFSGLIKLVYWEYLNYLKELFGNHPYVKARFYTKCAISKRVAQFAQEVYYAFPIQNKIFLKDPQDLDLNDTICDLQLQFSTVYNGPKVINTRIKKLDVYYDEVDYDPQLLSFFPNIEVVKLGGSSRSEELLSLNLTHLSNLKCLELAFPFDIEQLPTSLVKLALMDYEIDVADLSYLTSLQDLNVCIGISESILKGETPLPQSIVNLDLGLELNYLVNIQIQLPNLKELVIHGKVPTNITEQNFPSLKFIQLFNSFEYSLSDSPLSPTRLISQGLIQSVKLIKNEYLVELSCFPWWIQYSAERYLMEIFRGK